MDKTNLTIAVIDKDPVLFKSIHNDILSNHNVDYFLSHKDFGSAKLKKYDLIISNTDLPGLDGVEILKRISKRISNGTKLAIMTHPSNRKINHSIANDKTFFGAFSLDMQGENMSRFLSMVMSDKSSKKMAKKAKESLMRISKSFDKLISHPAT